MDQSKDINDEKKQLLRDFTFEKFRRLAKNDSLSKYEKIGFYNELRKGYEEKIFADIINKLPNLKKKHQVVMDIGPGCSELPFMLIKLCCEMNHTLILVDSQEMLDHLPDESFIEKVPAYYPYGCREFMERYQRQINTILSYSVFQIAFAEMNYLDFLDNSLELLVDGGQMLIGDIPNVSMRKRFFSSANGIQFHQRANNTMEFPEVRFNQLEKGAIDDSVILSILQRCRNFGFDAYILPQPKDLPMSNRREDLLISKP